MRYDIKMHKIGLQAVGYMAKLSDAWNRNNIKPTEALKIRVLRIHLDSPQR